MRTCLGLRSVRGSIFVVCLATAILSMLGARDLHAQGSTAIEGRVTDARSKQGVVGVSVSVQGTTLGAMTADDGRFRIGNVPPGTYTVVARRLGYAPHRRTIVVGAEQAAVADIVLENAAISLDQVIVTGTAGSEERRSIGNAVSTISADDAISKSGAQSVSTLIGARAPGVAIAPSTGRLGSGPAIQIRGRSSIGLDNTPLLYIDGVRVNNATAVGPVAPAGRLGGQASNVSGRLNDINPDDIESIEIIKGPAAATIYGTEAANGVIQIITKKGHGGLKPQVTLHLQTGSIVFRDAEGRVPTNFAKDPNGNIVTWNGVETEKARGTPIFKTGQTRQYTGSISGGSDAVSYYASGSYENDLGVEPNNTLRQYSSHANLTITPNPQVDFGTSLIFSSLSGHLGADVGASALLGAVLGHSLIFPGSRGFFPGFVPEVPQTLYDNAQGVTRFTGSQTINHRPTSWFTHRLIVGLDYTGDDSRAIEHFTADPALIAQIGSTAAAGSIGQTLRHNTIISTDYSGTAKFNLTSALSSASSLGGQFYRTELNSSFLGGTGFPGPGVETAGSVATPSPATQTQTINTTIGAYGQQQFGWNDRLFVTGALRVDNNSAFGEQFKWVTYPKMSLAWVLSEEPFFPQGRFLNTLKLRAAYGESGRQPAAFSALRTFTASGGFVTPGTVGNPNLKPERGKELELGFEGSVFNRLNLDFTYFNKRTLDLILSQPVAPSSGFSGSQFSNLGRVDNHGIELQAGLQAITRQNFSWEILGNIGTNKDVIKSLGGLPSLIPNAGQFNKVGGPIGGIYTRRVVSADRDPVTGLPTNILCDGGAGAAPVACSSAPFVFIGTPTPKVTGSVANTVMLGTRLRLYALLDFKRGSRVQNADEENRCLGAVGVSLCRSTYFPLEYSTVYLAERTGNAAGLGILDQYFYDASFTKLRELSATFFLPDRLMGRAHGASLTLTGRDLHTWTKYPGIDPEGNVNNVATSSGILDQAVTPPLSRYLLSLNLTF
jgi:TonB-linked SusC/RagA family outer membrane protein